MALYEPGCMGVDVNFIRRAENTGIIVSRDEFMIAKNIGRTLMMVMKESRLKMLIGRDAIVI